MKVKVEVSNRHIHLNKKIKDILFGKTLELSVKRELSQTGEFASTSTVTIKTDKGCIEEVRVVGPLREYTQVELSKSDTKKLGIKAPRRNSGDLRNAPGVTLVGPKGEIFVDNCVIIANRHLHMSEKEALKNNYKNNQRVRAIINKKEMPYVFVKVGKNYTTALHIDTCDAKKHKVKREAEAIILKYNTLIEIFILIIELLIFLLVFDFLFVRLFNSTPVVSYKEVQGGDKIYNAVWYRVYRCKDEYGSEKNYIVDYNQKFNCSKIQNNFEIEDRTGDVCAEAVLYIYEDDNYKYYLPCLKNIYVVFSSGIKLPVNIALQGGIVKISELENKGVDIFRESKN